MTETETETTADLGTVTAALDGNDDGKAVKATITFDGEPITVSYADVLKMLVTWLLPTTTGDDHVFGT